MPSAAGQFSDSYDQAFQSAVKRWWPDLPHWELLKAQCYQESLLNPLAVSPAGAKGLCQFMSGTFADVSKSMAFASAASPFDPDISIEAAAFYMAKLRHTWRRNRTPVERNPLGQASYNAGAGNIIKAQAFCDNARLWNDIAPCLVLVTGERNSHETRTYVERIAKWYRMMVLS